MVTGGKVDGFDLWVGRSPGGGNGNPLQYSCLGNPMDRKIWWAAVHGVTRVRGTGPLSTHTKHLFEKQTTANTHRPHGDKMTEDARSPLGLLYIQKGLHQKTGG